MALKVTLSLPAAAPSVVVATAKRAARGVLKTYPTAVLTTEVVSAASMRSALALASAVNAALPAVKS